MRYLLDTSILSDIVRHPQGRAAQRARRLDVCTSIIVAAELWYGVAKKRSRRLSNQIGAVLAALDVLPFEAPADETYADLRVKLQRAGKPIGANDMLIAAQALALDFVVVTDNEREFGRIRGLKCENWLR